MRRVLTTLAVAALCAVPAAASTLTDTFDPSDVYFGSGGGGTCIGNNTSDTFTGANGNGCNTLSYTHSLVGQYNPLTEQFASGAIVLTFYDDETEGGTGNEQVDYSFDLALVGDNFQITNSSTSASPSFTPSLNVLSYISSDGILNVLISQQSGDFYFAKSVLTATTRAIPPNGDTAVPEPGSLLLLGSGLALAARRLRRRSKA